MSDFVSGDLHEIVVDELVRLRTLESHPTRGQQVKGELRIPHRAGDQVAEFRGPVMPRSKERFSWLFGPGHPSCSHGIHVFVDLPPEKARHPRIEPYVRVVNFSGERIHAGRSFRESGVGIAGEPPQRAVPHVRRIPIGVIRLLFDLDRILESNALERFVPQQDAFADGIAVFNRYGVFHPEHDGLLRRREWRGWILLLQPPAVDVPPAGLEIPVATVVFHLREEVPDAVVGQTWPEPWPRQFGNAVAEMKQHAADVRYVARRLR